MPNRIIKESVCTSDSIDKLDWFEEVLFYRLMVSCDDYGRFDGRTAVIKNRLFPLKEALTMEEVSHALQRLSEVDLVRMYEAEGKPYLYLPTWEHHQTIRAKRSKYPVPGEDMNSSEIICKQMQADVAVIQSNPIQSESNPIRIRNPRPCFFGRIQRMLQSTLLSKATISAPKSSWTTTIPSAGCSMESLYATGR